MKATACGNGADAGLADVNLNNLEERLKQFRKDFEKK